MRAGGPRPGYLLLVLVAAYILSFADRQIIGFLAGPLQQDLGLSDTDFGLVYGGVFAVALAVASVPMGRLVDRRGRVLIVAVGVAFWSVSTLLCGLASGLLQLLVLRACVALGEAVLTPAAHSMIADTVAPHRLGRALSIYGMGPHLGGGAAFVLGGWALTAAQTADLGLHPWRLVLIMAGAAGLAVAGWVLTLSEPSRAGGPSSTAPPLREVLIFFRTNWRAFLLLKLSTAFAAMMIYALIAWASSFYSRSHGWTTIEAGLTFGPVITIAGMTGVLAGGLFSDWAVARHGLGRVQVIAWAATFAVPFACAGALMVHPSASLACFALALGAATLAAGAGPAATMAMVPPRIRGVASALGVVIANLIGLGLGPIAISLTTEHVFGDPSLLRLSLALWLPTMVALSAACAFACLRPYGTSLGGDSGTAKTVKRDNGR